MIRTKRELKRQTYNEKRRRRVHLSLKRGIINSTWPGRTNPVQRQQGWECKTQRPRTGTGVSFELRLITARDTYSVVL